MKPIEDNLLEESCRPINLLRCKLAMFGATKFDPKSDLWIRIALFQGAPLAKDLRMLIREQIKAGKTDDEILVFIEDRYGEFALLKPRFDIKNAPLWALPFLLILAGIFLMRSFFRNAPKN